MCFSAQLEPRKVGDIDARIVDANAAGVAIRWFVDPQNGHILKETYRTLSQGQPVPGETDMEDWKSVNGLNVPFVRQNKQNGQDSSKSEYKSLEFNPTVDPKLFEKANRKDAGSTIRQGTGCPASHATPCAFNGLRRAR